MALLTIGDMAPDFEVETTEGVINFHQWIGVGYAVLFSHPKDFTWYAQQNSAIWLALNLNLRSVIAK